ncbi:MAG: hypothetical protein KME29_02615 [Calothrix sp. FI2-JRJ7]|jgi:oligoribonuclease NrnB/cAMP/cGMP phosphodiesterase (DHH superfamily)|nr:hypothetical protein [Calothrix sp. FI2-JRJ7]
MATFILYHANCYDGFGSAYAAWKALGDSAQYIPVHTGECLAQLKVDIPFGSNVYIQDFAYSRAELLELSKRCSLTVLDHHWTALNDLSGLSFAVLNLNKSGAMLAWEWWHPNEPVPELMYYLQDRDLQQFQLPNSQEVHYALLSYPMDFEVWDSLTVERLKEEGCVVSRFANQMVETICSHATRREVCGYSNIPTVNTPILMLEVKARLCQLYPEAPFTAYYFDREDGVRQWGLRANRDDLNVSEIAKRFGGGGHRLDAGFQEALN